MLDRILTALMALSLAFLIWLYARSRDQEPLDNMPIPVQIAPGARSGLALQFGSCQSFTSAGLLHGAAGRVRELRGMLQRGELRVNVKIAVPEERQNESCYSDTVHVEVAERPCPSGRDHGAG